MFNAIKVWPTFFISDIQALALKAECQSARMLEIKKLEVVGPVNPLKGSGADGYISKCSVPSRSNLRF